MEFVTEQGVIKPIVYVSVLHGDSILLVKYLTPPNPDTLGWWIPAPSLEFGESPEKGVRRVLSSLGLTDSPFEMVGTESFITGTGWHLIWHYVVQADSLGMPSEEYEQVEWFTRDSLPAPQDFAHGKWERILAERRLDGQREPVALP